MGGNGGTYNKEGSVDDVSSPTSRGDRTYKKGASVDDSSRSDERALDHSNVEIDYDQQDDDPSRGSPVAYHYRNRLFTRDAIRQRIRHHSDRYKHYPPMLQKQFQSDLAHVFNEEYPWIRNNIRPIYSGGRARNHYATQRSKKGEKRPPNCYTLFCNDVKASFSASYIQRKGIHNLWRQLSDRRKQQYREKARTHRDGQLKLDDEEEEDQEARWNNGQYEGGPKLPARGSAIKLYGTEPKNSTPPSTDESSNDDDDDDENETMSKAALGGDNVVPDFIIPPKRRYDSDSSDDSSSSSSSDSDD